MLEKAALRQQHANEQRLDRPGVMDDTEIFADRPAHRRRRADQHHHRDNAAGLARGVAAPLAIEAAVEEADRLADDHDGMRQIAEDHRHIAEREIDRQRQQQDGEGIGCGRQKHRARSTAHGLKDKRKARGR